MKKRIVRLLLFMLFCTTIEGALPSKFWEAPDERNVAIILYLKNVLDLKSLAEAKLPFSQRPKAIAEAMRKHTEKQLRAQFPQLKVNGEIIEITPLWILNAARIVGRKAAIEKLITWDNEPQFHWEEPKEVSEIFDSRASFSKQPKEIGWGVEALRAPEAWALGAKGQGVAVAVIDSGTNLQHPDLRQAAFQNHDEIEGNGYDDDGNGFIDDIAGWNFETNSNTLKDEHGHGTETAGIIVGRGTNGIQTGVAPLATLLTIRTCCDSDSQVAESNLWLGIQYAMLRNVRLISMSLSIKHYADPSYASWRRIGEVLLAAEIIHVNSAGNRGSGKEPYNIGAPGSNPPAWFQPEQTKGLPSSMITVGAVDDENRARSYSAMGPVTWEFVKEFGDYLYQEGTKPGLLKPDLCAPSEVPTTSPDGKHYSLSFGGTSSATPHISGVVALLLSERKSLSVAQVTEALQQTAVPVKTRFNNHCGAGRADAVSALEYVRQKF